jgi:hypothetical protein
MKVSAKLIEKEVPELQSSAHALPNDMRFLTRFSPDAAIKHGGGASVFYMPGGIKMNDGTYRIEMNTSNGKSHLLVKDKDNKSIYDGPVDSNAKDLPAEVRMKIKMLPNLIEQDDFFNIEVPSEKAPPAPAQPKKDDGF